MSAARGGGAPRAEGNGEIAVFGCTGLLQPAERCAGGRIGGGGGEYEGNCYKLRLRAIKK